MLVTIATAWSALASWLWRLLWSSAVLKQEKFSLSCLHLWSLAACLSKTHGTTSSKALGQVWLWARGSKAPTSLKTLRETGWASLCRELIPGILLRVPAHGNNAGLTSTLWKQSWSSFCGCDTMSWQKSFKGAGLYFASVWVCLPVW